MRPAFVTGYPGFMAKRLVAALVEKEPGRRVWCLTVPQEAERARLEVARLPEGHGVELLEGDVTAMHLGLSGREYVAVTSEVEHVFHLAALSSVEAPAQALREVNVEGTRTVLELCRDARGLERLVHFSSFAVAGLRSGLVLEEELEVGQAFRSEYEASKLAGEKLVRKAMGRLPAVVLRPAVVVGDSRTGEVERFEGPYALGMLLLISPLVLPLPLPDTSEAPLNVVPVDFVVAAALALASHPEAAGQTVHLVDPRPMSARRAFQRVAERVNARLPPFNFNARLADWVLALPGMDRLLRPQREALTWVQTQARYSTTHARRLLEGQGVQCPPLDSYLDRLVDHGLTVWQRTLDVQPREDPLDDPLEP
jgi:thioester reductase-like protein